MDNIRIRTEENERLLLSPFATLSSKSLGRKIPEPEDNLRTCFQRDRDRIIHCKAFRRLKHKTQVFLSPESDHYRTRLTHTLEVSQIARTVSRALMLNEDLTEAIALGHDLGHTPFGHAGERALNELLNGGFTHYEQSVRVCELLEDAGKGLNLTAEVLDGILNHTKGSFASTLEGRVVRFCDRIAYINHDIEDAVRGGIITENDIPIELRNCLGHSKSERITTLVTSLVENSEDDIKMSNEVFDAFTALHSFLFDKVYFNPKAKKEEEKVFGLVKGLFDFYTQNPNKLPKEFENIIKNEGINRAVADYIAGMTDHFAATTFTNVFVPGSWKY